MAMTATGLRIEDLLESCNTRRPYLLLASFNCLHRLESEIAMASIYQGAAGKNSEQYVPNESEKHNSKD